MSSLYDGMGSLAESAFPQLDFRPKQAMPIHVSRALLLLKAGDLVAVPFSHSHQRGLPWHFGIYFGNLMIIDICEGRVPEIKAIDVETFVGNGNTIYLIQQQYTDEQATRAQTVARATILMTLSMLRSEKQYNLLTFNCRHFCTFCCTGRYVNDGETLLACLPPCPDKSSNQLCGKALNMQSRVLQVPTRRPASQRSLESCVGNDARHV